MVHVSENSHKLETHYTSVTDIDAFISSQKPYLNAPGVYLFHFPAGRTDVDAKLSENIYQKIGNYCGQLHEQSTLCILTTPPDAAHMLPFLEKSLEFKLWIAVKLVPHTYPIQVGKLPEQHAALLVLTRYHGSLRHTKTRIHYSYCPSCGKTTKDYGGKKHTYHAEGTLLSDVWRDITCNPYTDINSVIDRVQDLFGIEPYRTLTICDLRSCAELAPRQVTEQTDLRYTATSTAPIPIHTSRLLNTDCLEGLKTIPNDSIDFCFADPPYNLQKKYNRWNDDMESIAYFSWCDQWLTELARVLKPERTLAVVNIPQWAVRYYQHLSKNLHLQFQQWIAWDAMSFPVRQIMPAHYTILCFSKGNPRTLPDLKAASQQKQEKEYTTPLNEFYCLREACLAQRARKGVNDRSELYDIWYDIHRLKHNSHRVDHPCQLPPLLMRRLYSLFTYPEEIVLDCFNGAGTSTLVAQQMGRRYIGIEVSPEYHHIAQQRHEQIATGENPFKKHSNVPQSKNSRVERLPKQHYIVPKKTLQLDVKRIAEQLGRLPSREEVKQFSHYPVEFFDNYFTSWGEVCAAARTTGMSELPPDYEKVATQLNFAFETF